MCACVRVQQGASEKGKNPPLTQNSFPVLFAVRCYMRAGNIRIAIKVGGSADPSENSALQSAIDAALKESVPKAGITKVCIINVDAMQLACTPAKTRQPVPLSIRPALNPLQPNPNS